MRHSLTRAALTLPSILCLAGSIVMLFLLLLAGSKHHTPLDQIFLLQADTSGIPGAPQGVARWTLYNVCNSHNGRNTDCGGTQAAYPFDPVRNFGTTENVPRAFIDSPRKFFYLSRFLYAIYVVQLFFVCLALLSCEFSRSIYPTAPRRRPTLLSPLSRHLYYLSSFLSLLSTFFAAFTASALTSCYVLGAQAFRAAGRFARVGVKAFAFTWTILVLLGIATILLFWAARVGRRDAEGEDAWRREDDGKRSRRGFSRLGGVKREDGEFGSEKRFARRSEDS
ncbi:SUR7/PalI family-domain-containing protein [Pyronema omphalodes]|nr:SUR7/PalI family-domain-containing protein [Pyronema omphalodes]